MPVDRSSGSLPPASGRDVQLFSSGLAPERCTDLHGRPQLSFLGDSVCSASAPTSSHSLPAPEGHSRGLWVLVKECSPLVGHTKPRKQGEHFFTLYNFISKPWSLMAVYGMRDDLGMRACSRVRLGLGNVGRLLGQARAERG